MLILANRLGLITPNQTGNSQHNILGTCNMPNSNHSNSQIGSMRKPELGCTIVDACIIPEDYPSVKRMEAYVEQRHVKVQIRCALPCRGEWSAG